MTAEAASSRPASISVAEAIRRAIARGDLVPNQRLIETDLTAEYLASRSAVREALAELAVEGLIERVQNRGARVRSIPVPEAVEIIEVRGALEALCVRKAAERITDEQIQELQLMGLEMSESVAAGELGKYSAINKRLHRRVVQISGQDTAAATIERLRAQSVRHQFRLAMQPGRASISLPEHLEIINAISARDAEKAARFMEKHMGSIAHAICDSDHV